MVQFDKKRTGKISPWRFRNSQEIDSTMKFCIKQFFIARIIQQISSGVQVTGESSCTMIRSNKNK